jgi:hypothetical protein
MVRNPSELARLEDELEFTKTVLWSKANSKTAKEAVLRKQHDLERMLGIDSKPYNGL